MSNFLPRPRTVVAAAVVLLVLGCAQQRIRDSADSKFKDGQFEEAVKELQEGVKQYPESPLLRGGLASLKGETINRIVNESGRLVAAKRFDDAQAVLQRGLAIEPSNERLLGLKNDLLLERKVQKSITEAEGLAADGKKQQALKLVEGALKEAPRQPQLLALQRRVETELRLVSGDSGRRGLAESRPITLDFRNSSLSVVLEAITRGSGVNFILDRDLRQDGRVTVFLRNSKVEDALDFVLGSQQLARRTIDTQTVLIYPNTPEKQREHQEQIIRVFHLSNAEAKATAAMLKSMLRLKEAFVDERANLISIRETPEIVALAERLVALHDQGDAEVMLDVEILEVKSSRLTELGINFPSSFSLTPLSGTGATGLTLGNLRNIGADRVGVSLSGLLVNLRREVGDFNILANPRIRAKSREKAKVLIGDKVPVITTSASSSGFLSENVSYLDVGLKLEVEPIVSPDDEVTIKLGLEVSSLAREVRTAGGSLAYQIGTRNANTVLRLRDGETQVLAGLISNEDRVSSNRVPGLGDLPLAGRLFSSQKDDFQRTELVLAITPRILRAAPQPDISQAELWVGTELSTRLKPWPGFAMGSAANPNAATTGVGQTTGGVVSGSPVPRAPNPPNAGLSVNSATVATPSQSGVVSLPNRDSSSLVAAGSLPAPPIVPAGPARVSWQGPSEVKAGEVFAVSLNLQSASELRGVPLEVAFPSDRLEVVDIAEGSFFKQNDGKTNFTHTVNVNTGRIGVGILRGDTSSASGQGSMLQLQFKAKAAGPVELSLTSLRPIGASGPVSVADLPLLRFTVK